MSSLSVSCPATHPADRALADLAQKAQRRKGKLGKAYHFFERIFALPLERKKIRDEIRIIVEVIDSKWDKETRAQICEQVLSYFRPDEFDRTLLPTSVRDELTPSIEGSTTTKVAQLSLRLGLHPKENKGAHSSKIFFNLNVQPIAIFKSDHPEDATNLLHNVGEVLKKAKLLQGQSNFLPFPHRRELGAMISERATYLFAQLLGQDLVPMTEVVEFEGKRGSFQHFVSGYKEADEVRLPSRKRATEQDLTKFQIFAIIDYLTGGLDRKGDNWLVKLDKEGHIRDIKMIDNGNNFTQGHVPANAFIALQYQYKWRNYSIARAPLTEETKTFIRELPQDLIQKLVSAVSSEFPEEEANEFFHFQVLSAMRDRLHVVQALVNSSCNLVDLSRVNNAEAFRAFST